MVARRMLPVIGGGRNYVSSIHVDDAGRAVAMSVGLAQGIYNAGDDDPVPAAEFYDSMAAQLQAPRPYRLPRVMGPVLLGPGPASYLLRSLRASNQKLKQASGWQPRYPSVREGWATVRPRTR
jgi:NAD dependent epimerase/dehydratase family enzyme